MDLDPLVIRVEVVSSPGRRYVELGELGFPFRATFDLIDHQPIIMLPATMPRSKEGRSFLCGRVGSRAMQGANIE